MTKEQERARARRRYERQQATLAQRESDHARRMRLVAIITTVLLVLGVAGVLGAVLANDPADEAAAPTTTAAGCELPPTALGTAAELPAARQGDRGGQDVRRDRHDELRRHRADPRRREGPAGRRLVRRAGQAELLPQRALPPPGDRRQPQGAPVRRPHRHRPGHPGLRLRRRERPDGRHVPARHPGDGPHQRPRRRATAASSSSCTATPRLPDPDGYTVFGTVTSGLDIVDRIAAAGVAPGGTSSTDGFPAAPISILRVAVTEKKA